MSVWENSTSSWICESMKLRLPQRRPPQRWRHLFLPECCVIATICCYCWISTNTGLLSFSSFFLDLRIQNLLMIAFLFFLDLRIQYHLRTPLRWAQLNHPHASGNGWLQLRPYLNPVPGVSWISSVYTCNDNIMNKICKYINLQTTYKLWVIYAPVQCMYIHDVYIYIH